MLCQILHNLFIFLFFYDLVYDPVENDNEDELTNKINTHIDDGGDFKFFPICAFVNEPAYDVLVESESDN